MSLKLPRKPEKKKLGWLSWIYKIKFFFDDRKAVRRTLVFIAKGMERDPDIGTEFLKEAST